MERIPSIAQHCRSRWGKEDELTNQLDEKLKEFIMQVDAKPEVKDILLELLKHYNYYSRENVNTILREFYDIIINEFKIPKSRAIYSRIETDSKINSSNNLLEEYKTINNIGSSLSRDIEKLDIEEINVIDCIIFIDDIIGSGDTITKFLEKHKEKLKNVICLIFCIECMEEGRIKVEQFFQTENIDGYLISKNEAKKAFENNYIFEDGKSKRIILHDFEYKLSNGGKYVLGYGNSEALVSFYRNTPNNTISSYWNKYRNWNPLFMRDFDKPDFMNKPKYRGKSMKDVIAYNIQKYKSKGKG